jgi:two-component system, OmpR family, sensor histidine kinase MtrB
MASPAPWHTGPMSHWGDRRRLRLRTRVMLFFSLTALAGTVALAVVTVVVSRNYLLDQRRAAAQAQAFSNASAVLDVLETEPDQIGNFMQVQLRTEGQISPASFLLPPSTRIVNDQRFQNIEWPQDLQTAVAQGSSAQQQFSIDGQPFIAVGVYIAPFDAQYFEAFSLDQTERSLQAITTALGLGILVTTLAAAGLGWYASRRLLRPLSRVADAAQEIASGGLETRLPPESDPDLAGLASSFNEMADAVQTRIEREARFASDVSHELRSPITALSAAVEVLDTRRGDLPDRSQQALDVVVGQVRRFDQMVIDLLELARIDAGSTEVNREDVDLRELIDRINHRAGFGNVTLDIAATTPSPVKLDKLRFERILTNLLENAATHAGGPVRVAAEPYGAAGIVLSVDDAGPGVARGERSRIFERFARGSAARHRIGTGLGLALVSEHAHAHGGEAWVEDRPGGGARFRVSFAEVV